MALKWKDKRDVCMLSSIHNEEMQTVRDRNGGEKQNPKVCINYSDAMGGVDLSDQYIVTYSMTRKRMKKYYQKIFRHLLDLTVFNSFVTFRKHGGKYTHLQFRMHVVQKLFEKYGGATPLEALPVRAIKTLHPDPSGRFTGRHFPDVNPLTGTRKRASKRCVVCMDKKEWKDTRYSKCNVLLCPATCF
jgi:hypothetical protein